MAEVNINAGEIASVRLNEQASDVTAPAAGYWSLYIKPGGPAAINEGGSVSLLFLAGICNGRLTLETGVPISTTDQTAKTTVYFAPYKGNQIGLYNGTDGWDILSFTELSLSLSGYTANKNYDIWVYNNSGTAALDSTIWTDDTTRATALATQDGIYVKTGATDRRYVGTIRITGTTGQCEDSDAKRYVWNNYNRVSRRNFKADANSNAYTTGAWRYWNDDSTLNLEFVVGLAEEISTTLLRAYMDGTDVTVALDDDASAGGDTTLGYILTNSGNGVFFSVAAAGSKLFGVGYHYISILQYGGTNGTFNNVTAHRISNF